MSNKVKYKRVLLKLTGEAFSSSQNTFDRDRLMFLAGEIQEVVKMGVELAVLVGGGNLIRGASLKEVSISRIIADHMGMLGTLINALALKGFLEAQGIASSAMGSVCVPGILEQYNQSSAKKRLEKKEVVILGGGTGNPIFTTDTAAVLRGKELDVDVIFKATKVDYVYDKDPNIYQDAIAYKRISFGEAIQKRLKVMDLTALTLAMECRIPIYVFNFSRPKNLIKAIEGADVGTLLLEEEG